MRNQEIINQNEGENQETVNQNEMKNKYELFYPLNLILSATGKDTA